MRLNSRLRSQVKQFKIADSAATALHPHRSDQDPIHKNRHTIGPISKIGLTKRYAGGELIPTKMGEKVSCIWLPYSRRGQSETLARHPRPVRFLIPILRSLFSPLLHSTRTIHSLTMTQPARGPFALIAAFALALFYFFLFARDSPFHPAAYVEAENLYAIPEG
ncbi:uncharacterized protein VTP21DRAFT_4781 [Calcarisporiella thermophila]|uniref:uncharacterized protein n=1 Tax=Calcarisporiella thermophila TaxID=911321 RepID=UPI003741F859